MAAAMFYTDLATAPKPNHPRRVGAAVALFHAGQVLLEYRMDSDYWAFIGGGVDDTESVRTAIRREIHEETAAELDGALTLYAVYSDPGRVIAYPDGNVLQVITFAFVGELTNTVTRISAESRDLRFFGLEELAELPIAPTHRALAADLIRHGKTPSHVIID